MAEDKDKVVAPDLTYEDEDIDELEKRLRKVELAAASTESTLGAVSRDIGDIKKFMERWVMDSTKITEIATKVEAIPRLESQMAAALLKYDDLYKRFIILEHSHGQCVTDRTAEKANTNLILTRLQKTETDINNVGMSVRELSSSKKQVTTVISGWAEKFIFIVMLYLIYLIIIHFSKDNAPGEILNNPPKLKSHIEQFYVPREKEGITYVRQT